jgi:hypothetical protein
VSGFSLRKGESERDKKVLLSFVFLSFISDADAGAIGLCYDGSDAWARPERART